MRKPRLLRLVPPLFILLLLQAAARLPASIPRAQTNNDAAFTALLQDFFAAYEKKDLAGLARLWTADAPEWPAYKQKIERIFAASGEIKAQSHKLVRTEAETSGVWLWVNAEVSGNDKTTGSAMAELGKMSLAVFCQRRQAEWKIARALSAFDHLATLLLSANSEQEKTGLLEKHGEFVSIQLAAAVITQGAASFRAANSDEAATIKAFRLAHDLSIRFDDQKRAAFSLNNVARVMLRSGRYEEALIECEKGLAIARKSDDKESLAFLFTTIGDVQIELGNILKAQEALSQSLSLREAMGDNTAIAETEFSLGRLEYQQGEYDRSFARFDRVLRLREEAMKKTPANKNLGYRLALTYNNIGILHDERGDYAQALRHFEKARSLAQTSGREVENLLLNFGVVYEKQGNPELAIEYYQKDLEVNRKRDNKPATAQSLINIGLFHQTRKDFDRALDALGQALKISEEINQKDLRSKAHNLIGAVHFSRKNHAEALKQFERSLALREEINDREGIADTSHHLALAYAEQGDLARAAGLAERAATLTQQIGKPELFWRINTTAGRIYLALNQPEKAQTAWQQAIATIEALRDKVAGGETESQTFFENKTAPYLALSELLAERNKLSEALDYAERAKARVLLDVLQSGRLNLSKAMTPAEQEHERKLNNELASLNTQLYSERARPQPNAVRLTELSGQLEKARLAHEDFRARLYAAHPELKVQRGEAKTLTMEEAAALLPDEKTAFLNYVVGPERVQLFVLTKAKDGGAKLRVYPLAVKREALGLQVEQFRGQLAGRDARFGKLARELYSLLLAPAQKDLPAQARLMIVPDGPLWELPFQALLTARGRYLWEDHVIAYAPSLTVLREMTKAKRKEGAARSLFAIGDPALGGESLERTKALMGGALEQLPEARTQVESLRKFYDANRSKVFTGAAAEEAVVKAEAGKFDILHFATHGVLNNRSPLYSHILLAQTGAAQADAGQATAQPKEDGLLEAWEIMRMDLRADLAVLSACETARGRVGAGEGMIGLTWALFVAGVPTTIVSQWKVRADSTADLMVEFHRQLQTSGGRNAVSLPRTAADWTKAEALRQAALKLLRRAESGHPFYWAGFVLIGQPR